jgi:carboxymethylenebutenolidase
MAAQYNGAMSGITERVAFTSRTHQAIEGALALPAGGGKAPAVVVLQEWWGVNEQIQTMAARLAAEGFVALVPDLYRGKVAKDAAEAGAMMNGLDWGRAMDDIAGAVEHLRAHPRATGKVAVIGFCMGGALAFATAAQVEGLAAVVPFYGIPSPQNWGHVTAPIQAHFSHNDGWAKPDLAREIQQTLQRDGKSMELHIYEAEHAFMNDRRPEVYDPAAAKLAWDRAIAFLRTHTA